MRLAFATILLVVFAAALASAQDQPTRPSDPRSTTDDLVDTDPLSDDPIGIDVESDLSDVEGPPGPDAPESPAEIALRGPRPPSVRAQRGQVLSAINAVRETHHAVSVSLENGLADVSATLTFASRARHPAEVAYRLAVPTGAALSSLRVCVEERCRDGQVFAAEGRRAYEAAIRARGPAADGAPVAWAQKSEDERGSAIMLRAAPVPPRGTLTVEVHYLARAPIVGGVARVVLPGRGQDPRAAPTSVEARAPGLIGLSVDEAPADGALVRDAWYPIAVAAQLPTAARPEARIERFRCGDATCARATVSAGPRGGGPVDLIVAVDASPSTEGPARSRIGPAVAALLSTTPRGSRVWALAFGAESRGLVETPREPSDVPLVPLARAANAELGSATRVEVAVEAALRLLPARAGRPRHLVIIGDGGITRGPEAEEAFATARRQRMQVSVIDVADRPPRPALAAGVVLTEGTVIEAGPEAERAARGRGTAELEERIARLFAPAVERRVGLRIGRHRLALGALRAGEQIVWEGVVPGRLTVALTGVGRARVTRSEAARGRALEGLLAGRQSALYAVDAADTEARASANDAACIDERGPAQRAGGVSSDAAPVAVVDAGTCGPAAAGAAGGSGSAAGGATSSRTSAETRRGRGMPAESVLRMLRQRVRPVARRCFRRDRAGRLDYAVRAEFVVRLEDRELTEARVDGEITDELRACLVSAVHDLDVPRFSGAVVVRYPLYTERAQRPPTIELVPEVAREVDAVIPPEDRRDSRP